MMLSASTTEESHRKFFAWAWHHLQIDVPRLKGRTPIFFIVFQSDLRVLQLSQHLFPACLEDFPIMALPSEPRSSTSTSRSFANQTASAEDLLKSQTFGLVNLSDLRKRRAEVLEQKEKEAQDRSYGRFKPSTSGSTTPALDSASDG